MFEGSDAGKQILLPRVLSEISPPSIHGSQIEKAQLHLSSVGITIALIYHTLWDALWPFVCLGAKSLSTED